MLVCNLKPEDLNVCMECMDSQIKTDTCMSCLRCPHDCIKEDHILVSVGTSIFGRDYAMVTVGENRTVKRVPLRRVMCVREKH